MRRTDRNVGPIEQFHKQLGPVWEQYVAAEKAQAELTVLKLELGENE